MNLAHGRVKLSLSVDSSVGADLWKSERLPIRLQGDVQNMNNRLNVIDFVGLFSGNAVAPPRSYGVRFTTDFLGVSPPVVSPTEGQEMKA